MRFSAVGIDILGIELQTRLPDLFVWRLTKPGGDLGTIRSAMDLAVLQKVLPKFHGTQQELEQPIEAMLKFAISGVEDGASIDFHLDDWRPVAGRLMPPSGDVWMSFTMHLPISGTFCFAQIADRTTLMWPSV